MNALRKWIRNVFGFSGNEINGFLILIPLMLVLVFSEPAYHAWVATRLRAYKRDAIKLDSLAALWESPETKSAEFPVIQKLSHFAFDPNTAGVGDLLRLGFSPALANRIAAYRRKGGVFRVKSDLEKIYGLDSALYKQLYDYIMLPTRRVVHFNPAKTPRRREPTTAGKVAIEFDINTADTSLLKTIYGIGPTLAARIVKFRDRLGGFVSARQLNEVYGLDSMVVKGVLEKGFIRPDFIPEKINLNTADEKALSEHPYVSFKMARAIVNYRYQHGDFAEANDIKNLSALKAEEVERLLPYLTVKD
jgi:competence protein ComEA